MYVVAYARRVSCWSLDPALRPPFQEVFKVLKAELTQLEIGRLSMVHAWRRMFTIDGADGILAQRDLGVLLAQKRLAYRNTLKRRSARCVQGA